MTIPKISRKQMEFVLLEAPEATSAVLEGMFKEIPIQTYNISSVDMALILLEAARGGNPKLGPNGKVFVEMVVAWKPWDWEEESDPKTA